MQVANATRAPLLARIATWLGIPWEKDDHGVRRVGTWSQGLSGERIFALDPRANDFTFDTFVIGAAREYRFGNLSLVPYTVAEHEVIVSLYVEKFARERGWPEDDVLLAARQAAVHDKSESVAGDMIRPLKHQPQMRAFRKMEDRLQRCAYEFFGVAPTKATTALVKEIDSRVLVDEINQVMHTPSMYLERHANVKGLGAHIACLPWQQAAELWVARFVELWPDWAEALAAEGRAS